MAKNTDINEVEEVKAETKKEKTAQKTVRKYTPTDRIPCRSLTYGELLLTGPKTKLLHTWANYGDVTEMEYQDLQALKSTRSSYLYKPRFIIEDEELVEQWAGDFKKMYDEIVTMDVEALFRLPIGQLKAKLKKAPAGVQLAVKNMAGEKIMNGSLDSIAKIKAIDEVLDTQLMLYIK